MEGSELRKRKFSREKLRFADNTIGLSFIQDHALKLG
jgi:hypothetical protein